MAAVPVLLSRVAFREAVVARDRRRCVFCDKPAKDAHHILERRLWPDGGYYVDNGASVCGEHHRLCEQTVISVEDVRRACGITRAVIPPHLYDDECYDKWGNLVLQDGRRVRGELFGDPSVQKVLAEGGVLDRFTTQVKYPRTHHLPWSPGMHEDDRVMPNLAMLEGHRVVVTRKMDGENTTMYHNGIHARSLDGRHHVSRDWVKNFWAARRTDIPPLWRVCGENLWAKHSLGYTALPSFFMGFSVWDETNTCLGWDETLEWLRLLDIIPVPVLYDGVFDPKLIQALWDARRDPDVHEGYVVRRASSFHYRDFPRAVGKFVRAGHVQTVKHWMHGQPVERNGLAG